MGKKSKLKGKLKKHDNLTPVIYTYSFFKNKYKDKRFNFKVSVIMIGADNSESIESVLSQSFNNFELIVIDKSHDMPIKSKKIKYYQFDYDNVAQARNYAIEKSTGDIISYLDSGNVWNSEFLKSMVKSMAKFDCAYCCSVKFNLKKLLYDDYINLNSFIHKKELINRYGNFDENMDNLADWDLIIRYTMNSSPHYLKKSLVKYDNESTYSDEDIYEISEKYWHDIFNEECELIKNDFDEKYYLSQYSDEIPEQLTPIHHYLSFGYKEGKNPNDKFVSSYYRNRYKVKSNPLVHYLKNPKNKDINYFDKKQDIIQTNSIYLSNYTFEEEPLVSIIILNKDGLHHLKRLFEDFASKTNYSNYEIIVVDNASVDSSVDFLKSLDLNITVIENKENVSFAKGNNDAAKIAKGEYVLLLNNDIEPTYGWLNEMMGTIIYEDNVASVGAKLIYPYIDDPKNTEKSFTIQHSGDILRQAIDDVCLYKGHNQNKFSKDIFNSSISLNKRRLLVTGAVLLVKKSVYDELNGLDEKYWYGYEDIDFNLRVNKAGYGTVFASAALLFHHESATRKTIDRNNHKVFCKKWGSYLFKKLLQDKIERNNFFTDEKLNFLLVFDSQSHKDYNLHDFTKYCAKNGYEIDFNFDVNNLNVNAKIDILISFTEGFDVKNIHSRANIIKVLVNDENDSDLNNDYDIVLKNNRDLGEELISILYEKYLDS